MTPRLAPLLAVTIGAMFITNPAFAYTQEGGAYRFPTGSNTLHRAKYGDDRVDVTNEAALRAAVADPYISEIWLRADITLTNSEPLPPLRNLRHLTIYGRCNYGWNEDIARDGTVRNPSAAKCVIDADHKSGIFEVYGPARLDLWDLTLKHGQVDKYGGAVAVTYGRVEFHDCEVSSILIIVQAIRLTTCFVSRYRSFTTGVDAQQRDTWRSGLQLARRG